MRPQSNGRVSGHLIQKQRDRGPVWYAKTCVPNGTAYGKQSMKLLGDVWTGKGRPSAGYLTKKGAQEALEAILTDLRRGDGPAAPTGVTFEDACAAFLRMHEEERRTDHTTLKDYRTVIDKRLIPEFGHLKLEAVTTEQIRSFKRRLMVGEITGKPVTARTTVRHLVVLSSVFRHAMDEYGLARNPADRVERPRLTYNSGEFQTFTREQVDELIVAAASPQDAAMFRLAAFSGLRQGEQIALQWRDVDFVTGMVHVRRNYTDGTLKVPKGKKVRAVPMVPEVVTALAKLKERGYLDQDDDLVFVSPSGTYVDQWALRRRFYKAIAAAELPVIRYHDLRHFFGTQTIAVLDASKLQGYMGHANIATTMIYVHHRPNPEDAAKMAQAFAPAPLVPTEIESSAV